MKIALIEKFLISYLGGWEGNLSSSRLAKALDQSREHASRKSMSWARQRYALSVPEGSTHSVQIEDDLEQLPAGLRTPREVLDCLPGLRCVLPDMAIAGEVIGISQYTSAEGDPEIFRRLYKAMCRKEALLIDYKARSGTIFLWFSPHHLVDLVQRPHFRGHALWVRDRDGYFIDVVPARVSMIHDCSTAHYVGEEQDAEWSHFETITLRIRDELPSGIKNAVIQEWGHQIYFCDDQLELRVPGVRQPLVPYVEAALMWRVFSGKIYEIFERPTSLATNPHHSKNNDNHESNLDDPLCRD